MSREEEDKLIRETMADIAKGLDGYEIVEEDIDYFADIEPEGDIDKETMADIVGDIDDFADIESEEDPFGDSMASIVQEITILEAKINTAVSQRAQITDKKKELSKARGNELTNKRNGIER